MPGTRIAARRSASVAVGRLSRFRGGVMIVDLVAIVIATASAITLRHYLPVFEGPNDVAARVLPVVGMLIALWMLSLIVHGTYALKHLGAGVAEYQAVLRASLLTAAGTGIWAYLFSYPLSRAFFFLTFALGIPLLLVSHLLARRVLHQLRRRGRLRVPILLVGSLAHARRKAKVLARERWLGCDVVGALTYEASPGTVVPGTDVPVVGDPLDVVAAVRRYEAVAVVFLEGAFDRDADFNDLARELEQERAALVIVPAANHISPQRVEFSALAGMALMFVDKPQATRAQSGLKRAFDLVATSFILLLASPIMLATAIAIKRDDGGPVLFRQQRVGLHGEPFDCFKFRSMVTNAEEVKQRLMAQNEGAGVLFKMKDDPRITKVGRFIRRYSIDELPQLFNVMRGEMSLVGPRPALPSEVERYERKVRRRLDVRPGITGLWQVSGRSDLSWDDTVRLDLYYVDNWSFLRDLSILLRTFSAVVGSSGAY